MRVAMTSMIFAAGGIIAGTVVYRKLRSNEDPLKKLLGSVYQFLVNKYYLDEIFLFVPDFLPDQTRPWKVVIASPALAYNKLVEIANADDDDQILKFKATLSGDQEVTSASPFSAASAGVDTETRGRIKVKFNKALSEAEYVL
jgi:hypothetical protein